jgi:hypothetical protein
MVRSWLKERLGATCLWAWKLCLILWTRFKGSWLRVVWSSHRRCLLSVVLTAKRILDHLRKPQMLKKSRQVVKSLYCLEQVRPGSGALSQWTECLRKATCTELWKGWSSLTMQSELFCLVLQHPLQARTLLSQLSYRWCSSSICG